MTIRQEFLGLLASPRAQKMKALERGIFDALRDGDVEALPALRADFAVERDRPSTIIGETREDLVAQWPATYAPLPEWFTDPASVGEPGEPCIVPCVPPVPEGEEGEGAAGDDDEPPPPDLEAVRAEREGYARADHDRGVAALDLIVQTSKDPNAGAALAPAYVQLQADLVARLARISAAETVEELREL